MQHTTNRGHPKLTEAMHNPCCGRGTTLRKPLCRDGLCGLDYGRSQARRCHLELNWPGVNLVLVWIGPNWSISSLHELNWYQSCPCIYWLLFLFLSLFLSLTNGFSSANIDKFPEPWHCIRSAPEKWVERVFQFSERYTRKSSLTRKSETIQAAKANHSTTHASTRRTWKPLRTQQTRPMRTCSLICWATLT